MIVFVTCRCLFYNIKQTILNLFITYHAIHCIVSIVSLLRLFTNDVLTLGCNSSVSYYLAGGCVCSFCTIMLLGHTQTGHE